MFKNLPLKARIVAGISVIAAVGAVAVLAVILITSGGNTNPPSNDDTISDIRPTDPDDSQVGDNGLDNINLSTLIAALPDKGALNELHSLFSGYWTSGNQFVGFVYIGGEPAIEYGLFQTSFGARGKITDARAVSANEAELTIYIPATPATEMDDAKPARSETVSIDISNYNDNRINIKIENLGGEVWYTYEYSGSSL